MPDWPGPPARGKRSPPRPIVATRVNAPGVGPSTPSDSRDYSEDYPEKNGAGDRTRTYDPIITNDVLYQLSYTGILLLSRPGNPVAQGRTPLLNDWS